MRRILLAGTALAVLTGFAIAQSVPTANAQNKANSPAGAQTTTSPSSTSTGAAPSTGTTQQQGSSAAGSQQGGQSGQTAIREVDAAALKLTFYAVHAADMRASKLLGSDVYNLKNEQIGEVQDLIIDNGKTIKAVVLSVGGFLGIGERHVAVQPGSIVLTEQNDGSAKLVVNTNKDELKNAPPFNFADVDKAGTAAVRNTESTGRAGKSQ